jgi:hypothetical protein
LITRDGTIAKGRVVEGHGLDEIEDDQWGKVELLIVGDIADLEQQW